MDELKNQVSLGGDPNVQDDDNNTGLHHCVYHGSKASAKWLIAQLVDLDAQDSEV